MKNKELLYYTFTELLNIPVIIAASKKGICWIDFTKDISSFKNDNQFEFKSVPPSSHKVFGLPKQLKEYAKGNRKKFQVPVDVFGTEFQISVWKALLTIPYGELAAYKDIAVAVKHPSSSRAVGNAVGANPLPVIIPCHRVIASDGSLGGYSGGIQIKIKLLDLEEKFKDK